MSRGTSLGLLLLLVRKRRLYRRWGFRCTDRLALAEHVKPAGRSRPIWSLRSLHLNPPPVDLWLPKLAKTVKPLLELQSGGIFAIEKFPGVMMVGGEVVVASFETGDSAT